MLLTSLFSCVNYEDEILTLQESISDLEIINKEQSDLISGLQEQIDEIKNQQKQDRLAACGLKTVKLYSRP